ncbi:hypothetical protein N7449_007507 [Penicillium cf. viridicatum]|uniref:Major facilitator superfamily (MFS) profile domain-containing protein n=1 Tax=Penicillium cf. viridicatum TaxID=2972119 RepID=A0A9W9JHM6_9EURO|nr:hypothetical protein N7449_007507 [Penicillium cf. viridicatum]
MAEFTRGLLYILLVQGRKAVFYSAPICIVAGTIIQVCSFWIYGAFCAGRVLIGLGIGQFTATCLIYINEVAPAEIHGSCSHAHKASTASPSSYRIPMGLLMVLPSIMIILLPFIPESLVCCRGSSAKIYQWKNHVREQEYGAEEDMKTSSIQEIEHPV